MNRSAVCVQDRSFSFLARHPPSCHLRGHLLSIFSCHCEAARTHLLGSLGQIPRSCSSPFPKKWDRTFGNRNRSNRRFASRLGPTVGVGHSHGSPVPCRELSAHCLRALVRRRESRPIPSDRSSMDLAKGGGGGVRAKTSTHMGSPTKYKATTSNQNTQGNMQASD